MSEKAFFNSIAEEWDKTNEVNKEKINFLLSRVHIQEGDKVLDIGTGTGVLIPFIREFNKMGEINALDVSEGMLYKAKEKYNNFPNIKFTLLDVEEEKVEGKYNKIILYSMFPHLKRREDTIRKLVTENLCDSGKLIIAHSSSREFLNNMHSKKDERVKKDRLIEVNKQKKLFEEIGLNVYEAFEDDNIYYLIINR
ncbi:MULTISPECIES: class I SAM-dependent methyltransferase [Clostridium]|uniref:class I SAM-dependent methyltransferase n=1 Tax=Clostridium TaxID=1485 RepID=UPI000667A512|nr:MULTISPECIES: methyltransferase domain-containing protein [Clostridium]MBS7131805.1 methyltransferase domain-containing protein [Clostridium sp.]MDB2084580.1 methyltransferase domain-containing protein [Clostridium paraputrificum]MDB2091291.1 methyltransferase domain-containing protein [Clostridium paraputrificum]MDB2107322.1 methyltransferase domain-containing protein [Clostridium paraputrificum]MDB2113986.1 methyltransferase domain-containing protein [Clostridium paraputrificum]